MIAAGTDPAVEAVTRSISPAAGVAERQAALAAAREALKPIQEWWEDPGRGFSELESLIYPGGQQ